MVPNSSIDVNWPPQICGLCGGNLETVAQAPNYLKTAAGTIINKMFPLQMCTQCQTIMSLISPTEMIKHLEVASHTNPQKEKFFYDSRIKYFVWIIERFLGPPGAGKQKVLDFGTSFGHMTSLLTKRGYEVTGVEINPVMRATASRNAPDARIIKDLEDLSDESGSFDIVLALDSLYFATLPSKTISDLSRLLKPRGKIIMRNTNRIWFYKIKRLKGRIMKRSPLGDARFAFSVKGLVTCLLKNGMNSIQVHYLERGKENSQLEKCLYFLSGAIAELTRGRLACCPGTIIEARKATT